MFQKNYVRIKNDIKKALMVQIKQFIADDYTFSRERESPAESSLKNKVVIDFHTGAAAGNGTKSFLLCLSQ